MLWICRKNEPKSLFNEFCRKVVDSGCYSQIILTEYFNMSTARLDRYFQSMNSNFKRISAKDTTLIGKNTKTVLNHVMYKKFFIILMI